MSIEPYVLDAHILERHDYSPERWAVDYVVTLGDKNILHEYQSFNFIRKIIERVRSPRYANPNGKLGYEFFFLVCSEEYAQYPDPKLHDKEDVRRALIQKKFDNKAALDYLKNKVTAIGNTTTDQLGRLLRTFLDTADWDEDGLR